ncbi:hypothetical protein FSY75_09370 [Streptomyces sp. TR1341]|uniref:hypothetical protein n=1 Tax=Streptomyces sp. TR1341 TaxID=2601266 RepID=UPI00138B17A3|nr:hypothetical protein [Streptomyces sp. TR1341]
MATNTTRKPITPTTLTAAELADFLVEQVVPLRALFHSGNPDTQTGSVVVHDGVMDIAKALRAGEIAPVVAQVRLVGINRRAARYYVRTITAHRPA